jgi:hypothetical protein
VGIVEALLYRMLSAADVKAATPNWSVLVSVTTDEFTLCCAAVKGFLNAKLAVATDTARVIVRAYGCRVLLCRRCRPSSCVHACMRLRRRCG